MLKSMSRMLRSTRVDVSDKIKSAVNHVVNEEYAEALTEYCRSDLFTMQPEDYDAQHAEQFLICGNTFLLFVQQYPQMYQKYANEIEQVN